MKAFCKAEALCLVLVVDGITNYRKSISMCDPGAIKSRHDNQFIR